MNLGYSLATRCATHPVACELNVDDGKAQWVLALEPVAGLSVEPERAVPLNAQGLALWRIFDPDSKSPRAALIVQAMHRGKDGTLDLLFCGSAEDFPGVTIPLAQRVLSPLTVRTQAQALQLRGGLAIGDDGHYA